MPFNVYNFQFFFKKKNLFFMISTFDCCQEITLNLYIKLVFCFVTLLLLLLLTGISYHNSLFEVKRIRMIF